MSDIQSPDRQYELVTKMLKPVQRVHTWIEDVTNRLNEGQNESLLSGTGSPEGVVEAKLGRRYYDTAGTSFYTKTTDGGDTGWIIE